MNPPQSPIEISDEPPPNISPSHLFQRFCQLLNQPQSNPSLNSSFTLFKIIIGGLLIQGYRLFKRMISEEFLIFTKPSGFQSEYLYLRVMMKEDQAIDRKFISSFRTCLREIDHLRRRQQNTYKLYICFMMSGKCLLLHKNQIFEEMMEKCEQIQISQVLKELTDEQYEYIYLYPTQHKDDPELAQDSEEQFAKLKQIMHRYVDTFGKKYKNNYFVDIQKQCNTSYNMVYLLNTINLIIFQVTRVKKKIGELTPMYNQIESASWTSFNKTTKQMQADRKDIMLSGNSRMMLLDIIFLKDMKKHVNQLYRDEVRQIISEYKKSFIETCVKVVKITNEMKNEYSYRYETKLVDSFSKIVTIID